MKSAIVMILTCTLAGEHILASGAPILVRPTAPYYYEDAVKEKVVHEVLVPEMLEYWFRNREDGGAFLCARQACISPW